MKITIIFSLLVLMCDITYSQLPCDKSTNNEKYIEEIVKLNMGPQNTLLLLNFKNTNNTVSRYLISSRDFADLVKTIVR